MRDFQGEVGYVTFAQNNKDTNYLRLAYIQALSLKTYMPNARYAVIVDEETKKSWLTKYATAIDYVLTLDNDYAKDQDWKFNNEWQLYRLTPFRETIKLEADLLFTRDIGHWLDGMRQHEILLTTKVCNFRGEVVKNPYRGLFDMFDLPNVYNGFSYFRYSRTMAEFFGLCKKITVDWNYLNAELFKGRFSQLTTDVMYALAAKIHGVEDVTNPALDYPIIAHMKGGINGLGMAKDWSKYFYSQVDEDKLLVGLYRQFYPFHYHVKGWATDELEAQYERSRERAI